MPWVQGRPQSLQPYQFVDAPSHYPIRSRNTILPHNQMYTSLSPALSKDSRTALRFGKCNCQLLLWKMMSSKYAGEYALCRRRILAMSHWNITGASKNSNRRVTNCCNAKGYAKTKRFFLRQKKDTFVINGFCQYPVVRSTFKKMSHSLPNM